MTTWFITGASRGFGREVAYEALSRGDRVVAAARSVDDVSDLAKDFGERVLPVALDVTDTGQIASAVQTAEQHFGGIDVLNAGIAVGGAFVEVPLERHLQQIAVNVIAPVRLVHGIVAQMAAEGRGQILFVSSLSATTPTPFETVYGPTKSFLTSFAHRLREELRGSGVSVTTLHPGATATEFHARAGMADTKFGDNSWKNSPALVAQQGYDAMRRGTASVIGGDAKTKRAGLIHRLLSEETKARRQARLSRDSG